VSDLRVVITTVPLVEDDSPLATPAYLKSLLIENNIQCVGLDLNIEILNIVKNHPLNRELKDFFLRKKEHSIIAPVVTNMLYHYVQRIMQYTPTHILLSLFTIDSQEFTKWISALLKHLYPNIKILIGGPGLETLGAHNYNYPERLKELGYIDHYFVGDANDNFVNYFTKGETVGFDNVFLKQNSQQKHWLTPNFDDYNFMNYSWLSLPIVDSRGCVQNCEFCDVVAFWKKFQYLTADEIFSQMLELSQRYNVFRFQLASSICNGNLVEFRKLMQLMAQHNDSVEYIDQEFHWHGSFIIRQRDRHSEELWKNIKRSNGFLYCGVESISSETRIKLGKNFNNDDLATHLEFGKKYDVPMNLLMIASYHTETQEDHEYALQWFEDNKHYANNPVQQVQLTQISILEGTRLQENVDLERFNSEKSMRREHAIRLKQKVQECGFTVRAFY
jgi:hypothetical protein